MSMTDAYGSPASDATSEPSGPRRLACSIRNLTKDYVLKSETVHALRGVSFDVPEGDYAAIMGPSGSGKSTLINQTLYPALAREQGLVTPDRNRSGHRRYARHDIRRLSFVMISQGLGFTLSEIREALSDLPENRTPNKGDWARISRRFKRDLEARIDQMSALRDRLDKCIGCGCLSLQSCKLYNPDDRIAARGSGPRFLRGDSAI